MTVLVIGDSISIGYTPHVAAELAGVAVVAHVGENASSTKVGLMRLKDWCARPADVIVFNFGLHDLKRCSYGNSTQTAYRSNLTRITRGLKATGAALLFCLTTPIPVKAADRTAGSEVRFNRIAREVMAAQGVTVIDLWTPARGSQKAWQLVHNVHFNETGYAGLGAVVAAAIRQKICP